MALRSISTCSSNVSRLTPSHFISRCVHLVTQEISTTYFCMGSFRNSSHVHEIFCLTRPSMVKVHLLRGVYGVGPAERTGKSSVRYWPGGMRSFLSPPRRLPVKPRETNRSSDMAPPSTLKLADLDRFVRAGTLSVRRR